MKLALIVLPERSLDNENLFELHRGLRFALTKDFGGYFETKMLAAQQQRMLPVFRYEFPMFKDQVGQLRRLAANLARDACLPAVMIITPQGEVEFIKPLDDNQKVD